eukprot:GILI01019455.1.p1 GENE.GILI01019455.1~~GILI01019455.1.p1  ORF type:complete len:285 (+),score=69.99 GILI01019455.1:61-915(+)
MWRISFVIPLLVLCEAVLPPHRTYSGLQPSPSPPDPFSSHRFLTIDSKSPPASPSSPRPFCDLSLQENKGDEACELMASPWDFFDTLLDCGNWTKTCQPDIPLECLTYQQMSEELPPLEDAGWTVTRRPNGPGVRKVFQFRDFEECFTFATHIARLAQMNGHHPGLIILFNALEVSLFSEASRCLSNYDLLMARAIERLSLPAVTKLHAQTHPTAHSLCGADPWYHSTGMVFGVIFGGILFFIVCQAFMVWGALRLRAIHSEVSEDRNVNGGPDPSRRPLLQSR